MEQINSASVKQRFNCLNLLDDISKLTEAEYAGRFKNRLTEYLVEGDSMFDFTDFKDRDRNGAYMRSEIERIFSNTHLLFGELPYYKIRATLSYIATTQEPDGHS
jgi:hypothetical protein